MGNFFLEYEKLNEVIRQAVNNRTQYFFPFQLECETTSLSDAQLRQQAEQRHNKSEPLNPSSTTCEYPQVHRQVFQ